MMAIWVKFVSALKIKKEGRNDLKKYDEKFSNVFCIDQVFIFIESLFLTPFYSFF